MGGGIGGSWGGGGGGEAAAASLLGSGRDGWVSGMRRRGVHMTWSVENKLEILPLVYL